MAEIRTRIPEVLEKHESEMLSEWIREQVAAVTQRSDLMKEGELREQSAAFLRLLREASRGNNLMDIDRPNWASTREMLGEVSRSRALQGFSPSETATFVLSLKQPLFTRLRRSHGSNVDAFVEDLWNATVLLDKLALYSMEVYQKSREDIIGRQQQEMFTLSSPVVDLWQGVLGLPLIGTLDSKRTQLVMEALLQRIADSGAEVAVVDITGVPAVDTLTAQHILKTVTATRLMGAECIISGVRPQIAQTIVESGIALPGVITKATLAGALAAAFQRRGLKVVRVENTGA